VNESFRQDDDDIEILEVIGIDDDAPPPGSEEEDDAPGGPQDDRLAEAESEPAPSDDRVRESLLRLQADFDNYRKRVAREQDEYRQYANAGLLERLLPILDNFERALGREAESERYDPFRDGIALIYRQLLEQLRKAGLRPLESLGEAFDPNVHEAVETEAAVDVSPNTVIGELQRGYRFHDRLLRPAMVKVALAPEEPDPPADDDDEEP